METVCKGILQKNILYATEKKYVLARKCNALKRLREEEVKTKRKSSAHTCTVFCVSRLYHWDAASIQ